MIKPSLCGRLGTTLKGNGWIKNSVGCWNHYQTREIYLYKTFKVWNIFNSNYPKLVSDKGLSTILRKLLSRLLRTHFIQETAFALVVNEMSVVFFQCVIYLVCRSDHDDVIKWKHFPRYWPFVQGIHRSPVNTPHKGQWRGALMFTLICARIKGWVYNREAGDLRRHRAPHYDVIIMWHIRF